MLPAWGQRRSDQGIQTVRLRKLDRGFFVNLFHGSTGRAGTRMPRATKGPRLMKSHKQQSIWRRAGSSIAAAAALALALFVVHPAMLAQSASADRWVGTWSTATVGRLQNPAPPAPALAPFMASACPV